MKRKGMGAQGENPTRHLKVIKWGAYIFGKRNVWGPAIGVVAVRSNVVLRKGTDSVGKWSLSGRD